MKKCVDCVELDRTLMWCEKTKHYVTLYSPACNKYKLKK